MVLEGGDQDLVHGSDARHEKIFVSVRLRPLNEKEIQSNDFADWECINNTTIIFKNCLAERSMYPNAYNFDRVFGNDSSTKQVYEEAAKEVALSVLNGINSSVFAYGQTSSGKTFTMGGITQYAVSDIYDYIETHKEREFVIKFSAIEIYNENVRDLLSADPTPLRCLDDPERGTVVEKLTEEILRDKSHLLELIAVCEAQRQTGETCLNETSSRSHQILRLTIESSARKFGGRNSSMLAANVNFVDLAGSERTSQTLASGTRLKEGSHINRSLLTLGKVIRTLSKSRNGHIPYRDSKLTRILHNSLGGNARTAIICTMSPAHSHLEQSRNTLLFASCAKEVTTNAQVNVVMSDKALVKQLKKELAKLESELKIMSSVPAKGDVTAILREKELQIEKMDREIKEVSRQRDLAQLKIEELLKSTGRQRFLRPLDQESSHKSSESREKISWVDSSSVTSDTSDYQRLDVDLTTSDSFQYLDEHSDFDLSTHRPDVLVNYDRRLLSNESSRQPHSQAILEFEPSDDASSRWEEMTTTTARTDDDIEDNCKDVRCIEVEEASVNRKIKDPVMHFPQEIMEKTQEQQIKKEEFNDSVKEFIASPEEKEGIISPQLKFDALDEKEAELESEFLEFDPKVSFNEREVRRNSFSADVEALLIEDKDDSSSEIEQDSKPHLSSINHEEPAEENSISSQKEEESPIAENELTALSEDVKGREEHHSDADYDALVKRIKELQRTIDCLVNRNPLQQAAPSFLESDRVISRGLIRSRSCKAVLTATPASEEIFFHHGDQSFGGFGNQSVGRFDRTINSEKPRGLPRVSDMNGSTNGNEPRLDLPNTIRAAIWHEMEQDVKNSDASDTSSIYSFVAGPHEDAKLESDKQMGYDVDGIVNEDKESEHMDSESNNNVRDASVYRMQERDCMSEGTPSSLQSPLNWHEEFESQRCRIIELWHACHIPLVHRTYFFLLFKGDPSDKLYMEVELRRLIFINKRFDQGQKIVMDGQIVTPSSSMKTLNIEREMLMKQIYKKIPVQERQALFEKWGIAMTGKQRRLQLVRRLWSDTKDMQHIRESASLVAKLVDFVDDGQVPKEMFVGPSLTPKTIFTRRSYSWISGMSSAA